MAREKQDNKYYESKKEKADRKVKAAVRRRRRKGMRRRRIIIGDPTTIAPIRADMKHPLIFSFYSALVLSPLILLHGHKSFL